MPSARTLLYLGFAKDEEGEGETEKDYELSLDNWNSPVSEIDCSSFTLHLDILWVHCHFLFLSGSWALAVILNLAFFFFLPLPYTLKVLPHPVSFVCGVLLLYCIDNTAISLWVGFMMWPVSPNRNRDGSLFGGESVFHELLVTCFFASEDFCIISLGKYCQDHRENGWRGSA